MTIPTREASASQIPAAAPRGGEKVRLEALDSLRGVCALMVVLFHANFGRLLYDLPLIRHSYLFVDFFFVLSGFIMYYNYGRLKDPAAFREFIGMRFFRLYPLHFTLLMIFVGANALYALIRGAGHGTPAEAGDTGFDLILNLFLLNGLDIRLPSFNTPSWSISTEFWTYVLFGSLLLWFRNVGKYTMGLIFAGVCLCALYAVHVRYGTIKGFTLFLFPRCIFGFFLGAIVGIVLDPGKIANSLGGPKVGAVFQAIAVIVAVSVLIVVGFSTLDVLLPVFFAVVIGTFVVWPHTWLTRALSTRPLLWLGKHSYSIYMVHFFVLVQMTAVLRIAFHIPLVDNRWFDLGPALGIAVTIFSIAIVLVAASQTYRYIEDPGRRFGRRLLKGGRAQTL